MSPSAQLTPGSIFAEDFRIVKALAEGGMGVVYEVEQLSTKQRRALKLMRPELLQDLALRQRFEQEARLPSGVASEHVAQVISAGVDGATGLPWFAMELLEGETLEERVQGETPIRAAELVTIFEQVCHALTAAHAQGIVHLDLKPENVFLAKRRAVGASYVVKILDFGIARILAGAATASTGVMGTPLYMAPEQYQGRGIKPQTDIWALGLMVFYAITRRIYWLGGEGGEHSAASLVFEACTGELPPASERASELGVSFPVELDHWFSRCVARDSEQRFASADQAIAELRAAMPMGVAQTVPMGVAQTIKWDPSPPPPLRPPPKPWVSRARLTGIALGAAALVKLAFVISRDHDADTAAQIEPTSAPGSTAASLAATQPTAAAGLRPLHPGTSGVPRQMNRNGANAAMEAQDSVARDSAKAAE